MDDLLADFLTETSEGLVMLDAALVRLERVPEDAATLSEVFRIVHTIKGTCGFLGLPRLEHVAHAAENVLGRYRDGTRPVTQQGISLILAALDRIRAIVAGLGSHRGRAGRRRRIADRAAGCRGRGKRRPAARRPGHRFPARFHDGRARGAESPAGAGGGDPGGDTGTTVGSGSAPPQTIRVSVDVLEGLMMLVSELVLTRNQLLQLARSQGDSAFAVPLQRLSHITTDLQEGVMKTRMQPIGNAWAKLPRLVRDLGVELGKKIALEMRGAETELDRQVLELIKDPLTHMVRSPGDHGLERPEERIAAGKPETGRILLNARHEGGHILIEIGDDGRGLSVERIRQKVLAQGLATEAELAGMPERDIHRFIFRPGFSTAAAVTAVSGRGVGMDVVKTNMERIGGTIDIRSREGHGTTFTIKIPLTLAIVSALIVEAGGERFAIPQIGVVELVRVGGEGTAQIERIKDAAVLRLRDRLLPLVNLAGLLQLDGTGAEASGFVVVTQVGGHVFGIIVDRVFDTEEIVVKPVAPILRHVTMFGGNTILGDGSVIMILDANGIARACGLGAEAGEAEPERDAGRPAHLLRSDATTALLLFRAGEGAPKAVPLGLVARLGDVERERIEVAGGRPLVQYRGQLMPLVPLSGHWDAESMPARQPVLVFSDGDRAMGLMVDCILDVVEERLLVDGAGERAGYLGSIVVAGKVTELLDTAWWLRQAGEDWFGQAASKPAGDARRVLLVEDSAFFRDLVVPALGAAGYVVTAVADAAEALRLRDAGAGFDAVLSDITMPGMDGFALARALRADGPWRDLPLVALTGRAGADDIERGREAGFTDYVAKFDRAALLDSLAQCLGAPLVTSADN
ncbi:chemotaxis protein CheW [Dankookia sp. P2]|uniref:hybrid sensor histidine kinase/response regulator n=1 Tax=Dankookia sp. P2 TaxID=3423955 RepID=UPI003D67E530